MKFDPYAFLETAGNEAPDGATRATRATQQPAGAPRVAQVARVARVAASKPEAAHPFETSSGPAPLRPRDGAAPHGRDCTGDPKTWTGKVVSLEAWRRLSDWERHGSTGKIWNGLTHQWEQAGGDVDGP